MSSIASSSNLCGQSAPQVAAGVASSETANKNSLTTSPLEAFEESMILRILFGRVLAGSFWKATKKSRKACSRVLKLDFGSPCAGICVVGGSGSASSGIPISVVAAGRVKLERSAKSVKIATSGSCLIGTNCVVLLREANSFWRSAVWLSSCVLIAPKALNTSSPRARLTPFFTPLVPPFSWSILRRRRSVRSRVVAGNS